MRQLEPFSTPSKNDGVVAHHIASTDRMNSDLERFTFAHYAFTPISEPPGFAFALQNFRERSGRSAGRVLLQTVMHFDNFQIEIIAKNSCCLFRQPKKRVHAGAKV